MNTRTRQAIRLTALLICGAAALVSAARAADGAALNGESLSFARDLARDMGGELSAAACLDGGCAFTLSLPLGTEIKEKEET